MNKIENVSVTLGRDRQGETTRRIRGTTLDVHLTPGTFQRVRRAAQRARSTGTPQRLVIRGGRPFELRVSWSHLGLLDLTSGQRAVLNLATLAERQPA